MAGIDKTAVITDGQKLFEAWVKGGSASRAANRPAIDKILDNDVVLVDYDMGEAFYGKQQVLDYLQDLAEKKTKKVTFHPPNRAVDDVVMGLDHLDYQDPAMPSHACGDTFKVNDQGLVTEVRVCFVKSI